MTQLTVACVLWMGEFENRHYSPEWVTRLRDMVYVNLTVPHRFVCLANVDVPGVETIPLKTGWKGWWAKLEIFDPRNKLGERVLYLDLDVFITGDLAPIAFFDAPMALMPPSHEFAGTEPRILPGVVRRYQASVITFSPPEGKELYGELAENDMNLFRADQDWIGWLKPDLPTMPREWFAKAPQCRNGVPEEVKVVLAHRVNLLGKTLTEICSRS